MLESRQKMLHDTMRQIGRTISGHSRECECPFFYSYFRDGILPRMIRTTVGILRGGTSAEYPYSLKTGAAMMNALSAEEYDVRDILIDKHGVWHSRGIPTDPSRALSQVDVVLNALHGGVGEDGTVGRLLERMGILYTGSRPHASSLAHNKLTARTILSNAGIRMPRGVGFTLGTDISTGEMARAVFEQMGPPYIVKPSLEGGSQGIVYVATVLDLPEVLGRVLDVFGSAIVEEYVIGDHAVVGVINDFRGDAVYTLPPARVVLPEKSRHTIPAHFEGALRYMVPSDFSHIRKQELEDMAREAHIALGLSHFSSVDFIVTARGPVLLEVDALPHLHEHAVFPHMLTTVGSSVEEFLKHVIQLARA